MKLTDKEEKIARLALDKAAHNGERAAAAAKLFESLHARGVTVEDIQKEETAAPAEYVRPDYGHTEHYYRETTREYYYRETAREETAEDKEAKRREQEAYRREREEKAEQAARDREAQEWARAWQATLATRPGYIVTG